MSACPSPRGAELTPPPSLQAHESDSSPPLPHPMIPNFFQVLKSFLKFLESFDLLL